MWIRFLLIVLCCLPGSLSEALVRGGYATAVSGFTTFTATIGTGSCSAGTYTGTCIIYVDPATGNNATCAPQPPPVTNTPSAGVACTTAVKGMSLLRDASSDWLLFNKGQTWTNDCPGQLKVSGISGSGYGATFSGRPILISSYGTGARPLFKTDTCADSNGTSGNNAALWNTFGGGSGNKGLFVAVVGLEFYSYTKDPSNPNFSLTNAQSFVDLAISFLITVSNWNLVEDCKASFYVINMGAKEVLPATSPSTYIFNRNIMVDAYTAILSSPPHSQGWFGAGMSSLILDGNVFDHNGWNATVSGSVITIFNHNWYIDHDSSANGDYTGSITQPATVINNIAANDSSGSQTRSGGNLAGNVFAGQNYASDFSGFGGTVTNNLMQGANVNNNKIYEVKIDPGYSVQPWTGATISGNLAISQGSGLIGNIGVAIGGAPGLATTGVVASNNIIFGVGASGGAGVDDIDGGNTVTGTTFDPSSANTGCGGTCSPPEPFPNPSFTGFSGDALGAYYNSLGNPGGFPSTYNGFMSAARLQSKDNWNPALTAGAANTWIRCTGFNLC